MSNKQAHCRHEDCHTNREQNMLPLPDGGCCDPCIEPIVQALQTAGIGTKASCCGHGFMHGNIVLQDGREIIIARDFKEARAIERIARTDINGDPINF